MEVKETKTIFDLELNAIDPSKKLTIIKEFKTIFGLGLKEAKELVEKLPVVLKKSIKLEEAELLKSKLESFGCTINLK